MKCDWPITLTNGEVVLRPLSRRDSRQWQQLRRGNVEWLREWEATLPLPDPTIPADYRAMIRSQAKDARAGRAKTRAGRANARAGRSRLAMCILVEAIWARYAFRRKGGKA